MHSEQVTIRVIAELLDVDEASLSPDLPIAAIEGWDSVNALRVLVYLERELGFAIDYDQFTKASCIGELARPRAQDGSAAESAVA
jgi:acyl carrier protein